MKIYLNLNQKTDDDGHHFKSNEAKIFWSIADCPTRIIFNWFTNRNSQDKKILKRMTPFLRRTKQIDEYKEWILSIDENFFNI